MVSSELESDDELHPLIQVEGSDANRVTNLTSEQIVGSQAPRRKFLVEGLMLLGLAFLVTAGSLANHRLGSGDADTRSSPEQMHTGEGIVVLETDANVVCDDFSSPNQNGCCSNGMCPSTCKSKSVSASNGITKCTCQHCPPPSVHEDEKACIGDDDRRLRAMRNGGNDMRAVAKAYKHINCMIGKSIERGQKVLQSHLGMTQGAAGKNLELLGLLASGAAAPRNLSAGGRKLLFGIGQALTNAGQFFANAPQQIVQGVSSFVSFLNVDQYFCLLLMPMCDCTRSTPPSWIGNKFRSNCVLGPPFAKHDVYEVKKDLTQEACSKLAAGDCAASINITFNLAVQPEFNISLSQTGELELSASISTQGVVDLDIEGRGDFRLREHFHFPDEAIKQTTCFVVNGFPSCIIVMLLFSARIEANSIDGFIKPSFRIDTGINGNVRAPFPFGAVDASIDGQHALLFEEFSTNLSTNGGSVRLTLSPEILIMPLPGPLVGLGTYANAQTIATGFVQINSSLSQQLSPTGWQFHEQNLEQDQVKATALNIWWQSEISVAGLPDEFAHRYPDGVLNMLQELLEDGVGQLFQRITKLAKSFPPVVMAATSKFLSMLRGGALRVVDEIMARVRITFRPLLSMTVGWQHKPPPHMCRSKTWGDYGKCKSTCPLPSHLTC